MVRDEPSVLRDMLAWLYAVVIAGGALFTIRPRSFKTLAFSAGYLAIGAGPYLNWFPYEISPPHGSFEIDTGSTTSILAAFAHAALAIVLWPLWPLLRAALAIQ